MWDPGSFWGPLAGSPGTCWVFSFSSHCLKTCSTGELEELLPVLFQLFYMPASLQTGTSLCVATLNGGPVCVSVGFTFCDHFLLSPTNTKPTPKPCHLARIRHRLLEPCKCQQDTRFPWRCYHDDKTLDSCRAQWDVVMRQR